MPLPFIPVAIGLGLGTLFGAKKAYDGHCDMSNAEEMNKKSEKLQKETQEKLESARSKTNNFLEILGKKRLTVYTEGSISYFSNVASKIKNIDKEFEEQLNLGLPIAEMLDDLRSLQVNLLDIAGGLLASASTGALASFGALGGVSAFATAGTGTAISSLAGIAAQNATLAWLGGGTLAAGGFGVAGGMAMVGGLAVAPLVLVGGFIMARKGEEALEKAKENRSKVEAYQKTVDGICKNLKNIDRASTLACGVITELDDLFNKEISNLESIINKNNDFRLFSEEERHFTKNCFVFFEFFKKIIDTAIMNSDGSFIEDSVNTIKNHQKFIQDMCKI